MESHKDLFKSIDIIDQCFSNGSIKKGQRLLKNLNNKIKNLERIPNKLKHKHNSVLAQSRYFNDISAFATNPKRADIINDVKDLINNNNLKPRDQANKIHNLQTKWQLLDQTGKPANKNLWTEFKSLTNEAWKPCADFFEELDQIKIENKNKRLNIITRITEFVDQNIDDFNAIKNINQYLDDTFFEWQKYAPVRDDDFQELKDRFVKARRPLVEFLKTIEVKNKDIKLELIDQVKNLNHEDNNQNIKIFTNIKHKFQKVGSAGKTLDNKLWRKLNKSADKFYAVNKKLFNEEIQLINEVIEKIKDKSYLDEGINQLNSIKYAYKSKEYKKLKDKIFNIQSIENNKKNEEVTKKLNSLITNIENKNASKDVPKFILNAFNSSSFLNNIEKCTYAVVELEICAGINSLKKDQPIRDSVNLKMLQDKFNSSYSHQERFISCLNIFTNNLSSNKPSASEIRLWKRLCKTYPILVN